MIPAEVMTGEVPSDRAIVEALHPQTLAVIVEFLQLQIPDNWMAQLSEVATNIRLTDPHGHRWSILNTGHLDWCSWRATTDSDTPAMGAPAHHLTAQAAADRTVAAYRDAQAAVAS